MVIKEPKLSWNQRAGKRSIHLVWYKHGVNITACKTQARRNISIRVSQHAHLQLTAISGDKIGGTLTQPHTNEIPIKGSRQENRNMASYYLPKQAVKADCSNYTATPQHGFCWNASAWMLCILLDQQVLGQIWDLSILFLPNGRKGKHFSSRFLKSPS